MPWPGIFFAERAVSRANPFRSVLCVCVLAAALGGCARAVRPTSPDDTPKNHYLAGLKLLNDKDPLKPEAEFARAVSLDPRSPYGYAGWATLALNRRQYSRALKYATRAVERDSTFADALFVMGKIHMERKQRGWFDRAEWSFKRLNAAEPKNDRGLFFLGEVCLAAYRFEEARDYFKEAAGLKGANAEQAARRKTLAERIIEAKPSTDAAKRVCLAEKASRSDVCRLLEDELDLKNTVKRYRLMRYEAFYRGDEGLKRIPDDVDEHPDRKAVINVLVLHLAHLDVYPDGYFHPERPVTRAEVAMILQEITAFLLDDQTIATRYATTGSPYTDVPVDYYAFNAIMLGVERGYLAPGDGSGVFDPEAAMSGVDVLLVLRAFAPLFNS